MPTAQNSIYRTLIAFVITMTLSSPLLAGGGANEDTGQTVYWRTTAPSTTSPTNDLYDPQTNPNGWQDIGAFNTNNALIPAGSSIYFGLENNENPNDRKAIDLKLNWMNVQSPHTKFKLVKAVGIVAGAEVAGRVSSTFRLKHFHINWQTCPAWEYIELKNTSGIDQIVSINPHAKPTICAKPAKGDSGIPGSTDDTLEITDGVFGVPGQMLNPMRITQLQLFPEHQFINPAVPASFSAFPHTGNWTTQPVIVDPLGTPREGIAFISDGPGLMITDMFDLSVAMNNTADTRYTLFALDDSIFEWSSYIIDLHTLPWYEDFEIYDNGEDLHGSSDWAGWDDDPAFDAPVTDIQSRSVPNALDIKDNTDLVRPFEGADSGAWTFEAWQYIPSDFTSGGGGQFDGSFFILLNTYNSGAPHPADEFSVQMQFDSNDGMLKVFHGNGVNTIDVPYITDQWVKIQARIDLEKDWTEIYYDDKLVTEYVWTGGVLGGRLAQPAIAAVDFVAQGSSSIFYDDLSLTQDPPDCPADLTGEGDLNFLDVSAFLAAFGAQDPAADFEPDGNFNFLDVSAFLTAFAQGCP